MNYWEDDLASKKKSRKKWFVIPIVLIALGLMICSVISMNSYKHIIGKASQGIDFALEKIIASKAIAIERTGAIHLTGTFTPKNLDTFTLNLNTLITGEVSGTVAVDDITAQVRGFSTNTYILAPQRFWSQVNGNQEFGDSHAMAGVLSRHWVQVPAGLFGISLGNDLVPNVLAQLIHNRNAFKAVYVKSSSSDIDGSGGIGIRIDGKVRRQYERSVKASLNLEYLPPKAARDVIFQDGAIIKALASYVAWSAAVQTSEVTFTQCRANTSCHIKFTETVDPQANGLGPMHTVLVSNVVDIYHHAVLVSICEVSVNIPARKNTPILCDAHIFPDQTVVSGIVKPGQKPVPAPIWDTELQAKISPLPFGGVINPAAIHSRFQQDLKLTAAMKMQSNDLRWTFGGSATQNIVDSFYSLAVTGLNPKVKFVVNNYSFSGIFGQVLVTPLSRGYATMVSKNPQGVTFSPSWATAKRGQGTKIFIILPHCTIEKSSYSLY